MRWWWSRTYFRGVASVRFRVGCSAASDVGMDIALEVLGTIRDAASAKTHSSRMTVRLNVL